MIIEESTRTNFEDLSPAELGLVWDCNSKLREEVTKEYQECIQEILLEQLKPLTNGTSVLEIENNHLIKCVVKDRSGFIHGLTQIQADVAIFEGDFVKALIDLEHTTTPTSMLADIMINKLIKLFIKEIKRILFTGESEDFIYNYFKTVYVEDLDDAYIINNEYTLYQDVTLSYA